MPYAVVKNGVVVSVEPWTEAKPLAPGFDVIEVPEGQEVKRGYGYDGAAFAAPDEPPVLTIALDAQIVQIDDVVTATAEIRNGADLVDVNTTYYVPIFDIDGRKDQLLKAAFVGGQATVQFSFSEAGIYTIDLAKTVPTPTSKLAGVVGVVVEPS